jgi:hypothetical protein
MRIFLIASFILILVGCRTSTDYNVIQEEKFSSCIGGDEDLALKELVKSFEEFLVENKFAASEKELTTGIKKYLEDIYDCDLNLNLKFDSLQNTNLVNKLNEIGFINLQNSSEEISDFGNLNPDHLKTQREVINLDGWPYFDPYLKYLPCLEQSIIDTTSVVYYYINQKKTNGSLAPNLFSWEILEMANDADYESNVLKEIIIFELYIGLLIDNRL